VEKPETVATAIRIGNPASWKGAQAARDASGGVIEAVSDEEILKAYRLLAQEEGIFGEPASAASLAGLFKMSSQGLDVGKSTIVCIITGSGLKDPDTAMSIPTEIREVPVDLAAVEKAIGVA
jgi:threonine synthase